MTQRSLGTRLQIAGLLAAALFPSPVSGQIPVPAEAWTLQTEKPVEWLRFLPANLLVVSHDGALLGLDVADGSVRWRRDDLHNVSQVDLEAGQQAAPLPGGAPTASPAAGQVIRLMEELPGGRLISILADSAGRRSWFDVLDVETGATVWSSTGLPITDARGFLAFPDSTTLLVHGSVIEPGRMRRVWLRVEAATGRLLWSTDSLTLQSPVQFDASTMVASRGTINGNQPLVARPDSTVLLYASADGLVCFDIGSGRVRWRTPLTHPDVGPIGQGYAPMLVSGDTAYLPAANLIDAFDLASGRHLWTSASLPTMTTQMAVTPQGLLLRGQPILLAGQDPSVRHPFLALLDPRTGKPAWKQEFKRGSGSTPFVLIDSVGYIASDEGLIRFSPADGRQEPLTTGKLPGRPVGLLEVRGDAVLVTAAQSLTLVGLDGTLRYQKEFPAPTLGLMGRILRVALGAVAMAGGLYYSGGYLAGTAFAKYQFSTTRSSSTHTFFVLKDYEGHGPALAKVDKATGETAAVLPLGGDKTPVYASDQTTGVLLLLQTDRSLVAYRL